MLIPGSDPGEEPGRGGIKARGEEDVLDRDALLGRVGQLDLPGAPDEGRDAGFPGDEGAVGPGREYREGAVAARVGEGLPGGTDKGVLTGR